MMDIKKKDIGIEKRLFFKSSKILNDNLNKQLLSLIGDKKKKKTKLIYSSSVDGTKASSFHLKCDGHSNTITLIETTKGFIFGGYTPLKWASNGQNKFDIETYLFSLYNPSTKSKPFKLPHKKFDKELKGDSKIYSISCSKRYGAIFGAGWDIALSEDVKYKNSCWSNLGHSFEVVGKDLKFESDEARKVLAGSYHFSVKEVEVFEIT